MKNDTYFKKILNEYGIPYKTMAKLVGVTVLTILRYANGERKPSWLIGKRIIDILGDKVDKDVDVFSKIPS